MKIEGYAKVGNLNPNLPVNNEIPARFPTFPLHHLDRSTRIDNFLVG